MKKYTSKELVKMNHSTLLELKEMVQKEISEMKTDTSLNFLNTFLLHIEAQLNINNRN